MSFSKTVVIIGLLLMFHAAYSAVQHRLYLRLTEQDFHHLPADILVQCLAAFIISVSAIVKIAGEFKEIKATAELDNKTWDLIGSRPFFATFNHRGQALNLYNCD